MTDNKRLASSRANGRKSRGPTSLAGKLRSSKNATRHGLRVPVSGSASDGLICSLARQVPRPKLMCSERDRPISRRWLTAVNVETAYWSSSATLAARRPVTGA
jgi:hypothetical protein